MSEHRFEVRQEEDTVPGRLLTGIALCALVISVLAVVASTALLDASSTGKLGGGPAERVEKYGEVAPPTIGLIEQTLIEHEDRGLSQRRGEEARLHAYGWVDRPRGVAHIPIERAMALVVDENGADAGPEGGPP
jgi:hypothetical protein